MAEACPRGRPGSRAASLGIVGPWIGPRLPRQKPPGKRSTRLFVKDPSSPEFSHLTRTAGDISASSALGGAQERGGFQHDRGTDQPARAHDERTQAGDDAISQAETG